MASKVNYNTVTYTIDLKEVFDRAYKGKDSALRSKLRPVLSDGNFKRAYGMAVIDEIVRRTRKEKKDRFGEPMPFYTKAYANSLAGKVYGKSTKQRANLTASGVMLSSMAPKELTGNKIVIHFVDRINKRKAHGHINGYKKKKKALVKDFLGLLPEEEVTIMKKLLKDRAQAASMILLAAAFAETTVKPSYELEQTVEFNEELNVA